MAIDVAGTQIALGRSAPRLTKRELVVLSHLERDLTLEEIAGRLFVSRNTVKTQVRSLYRKLGVSTRAEAVACLRAQPGTRLFPSRRRPATAPNQLGNGAHGWAVSTRSTHGPRSG